MMKHADRWVFYSMGAGVILLLGAMMIASTQPVVAQCGTSASSCKNCHETQGKMPVANNGDWHKAHAFGDFCEFCHAGNVQATAQDEAHVGMVAPLGDVKASCQGCHPNDYQEQAQIYASTLGVDLTSGNGASSGGSAPPPATSNGAPGDCAAGTTAVSAPLGGEQIDFNLLYTEATTPSPLISNWGNVVLILMILGTSVAFFITAWSWENWGQKAAYWIDQNIAPVSTAVAAAAARSDSNPAPLETVLAQKPELRRLLPRLVHLSPETLAALNTLLANPERIKKILAGKQK